MKTPEPTLSASRTPFEGTGQSPQPEQPRPHRRPRDLAASLFAHYGVIIAFLVVILIFSLLQPGVFPTWRNARSILQNVAASMIIAVGLTVVLAMQDFDLSFGAMIGLAGGGAVSLMALHQVPWPVAIVTVIAIGALAGCINGFVITVLGGSSFIITLAMGTILTGFEYVFTSEQTIFQGVAHGYASIGSTTFLGLNNQVWIALIVVVVLWTLLDATEMGRYMYAIGGNPDAARLSGIRVRLLRTSGFVCVGVVAAVVGILLTSEASSYTPNSGIPYLLPAYAGCFLGAACFRPGEFNVPGTVIGVLFLGTVATGLTMVNLQTSIINLVDGTILIVAVLLSRLGARSA
jgi:ribose transport system permease protein